MHMVDLKLSRCWWWAYGVILVTMRLVYTPDFAFTLVIYLSKPKDRHIRQSNDQFKIALYVLLHYTTLCKEARHFTSLIHDFTSPNTSCISFPLSVADSEQLVSLAKPSWLTSVSVNGVPLDKITACQRWRNSWWWKFKVRPQDEQIQKCVVCAHSCVWMRNYSCLWSSK